MAFFRQKISAGYFLIAIILIASYDYLSVDGRYIPENSMVSKSVDIERAVQQQRRPLDQFIQSHIDSGNGWPYRAFPLGDSPFNNAIPSYFYPTIGGYSAAKLSYYQDLIDILQQRLQQQGQLDFPILNILNVKYISYPQQLPFDNLTQVYSGNDGYVFENNSVLPKAFFVDSVRIASSAREAINAFQSDQAFNPATTAIVEGNPSTDVQPDTAATVRVTHYDARSIELTTNRSTPGFLVLSEIYYPKGWNLTIDGSPAQIYKTDYVLRGMNVPAGEHTLRMEFNPQSYVWGGRIAWGSNLLQWGIGLFGIIIWYRGKREEDEEENDEK